MRLAVVVIGLLISAASFAREILTVGLEDISEAVRQEFIDEGKAGDRLELEFFGGQTSFALENAESFKILISALDVSEGQNRFTAEAEIFADGKPAGQTKLFGRWFELTDVFVVTRDVSRGEIIQAEDLVQTTIRKNRLRDDIVLAKEDLEGKQALRDIKADKPISSKDIREEVVVKKGATVGMIYKHKGLQITARAEALEDGAKGQRIKLLNTKSQKELTGRVLDKNTVEIAAE